MGASPIISVKELRKSYGEFEAVKGISFDVYEGEIFGLLGPNGAGKSTLMKILYGAVRPDSGVIKFDGQPVVLQSARDAISHGIGMVFQHFKLAGNFLVWENVVLGSEPGSKVRISATEAIENINALCDKYGLKVDPMAVTGELGVGERQRVEILKVLYRGAKVIILDEPTAVLVPQEVDALFSSLKGLVTDGVTVIFISRLPLKPTEARSLARFVLN